MSQSTISKPITDVLRAPTYEVIAVQYGELISSRSHVFLNYSDYGQADAPFTIAYYFWAVRGEGRTIIIDTGYAADVAQSRGRTVLIDPIAALGALGVTTDFDGDIVLTHAHYDHIGNVRAFPNATFVMAQQEFDFWTSPTSKHELFKSLVEVDEIAALIELRDAGRLRFVDSNVDIAPGVRLLHSAGHTPGELMVAVDTAKGTILLTSDAVHFDEELERDMPFRHMCNLPASYESYREIRQMLHNSDISIVIPGHDADVMTRFPPAAPPLNLHAVVIAPA